MSYKDTRLPLETLLLNLPEDRQASLSCLLAYMKSMNISPHWYATNSLNVKYKNTIVFRFCIRQDGDWDINLTVARESDLDETLSMLSQDKQDFYFKNLRPCRNCNPAHGKGRQITILGQQYYICAAPEIQMRNPSLDDVQYLQQFVDVRMNNIKTFKP